ncbi:MAG: outer membrane beta-barrel protein [Janthinobacterium lividum]
MKMLRLALTATALVGSLATAMANTCSFSGFYAGGQIGMGTMNTHVNGSAPVGGIAGNTTFSINERFAATGVVGGLHLGYGKHFPNRVYMGVEGWGNLSNNKETHRLPLGGGANAPQVAFKAERKNAFGIALRPGMVFGNTLVNAILGVESAKFKYETSENFTGVASGFSKSKRRIGFVPGLEVSFHANDHVVLGVKATHTLYRKKDSIKTQATDVMAKASYKF